MVKKGLRQLIGLVCSQCKTQNYITERNRTNTPDKLELKKFCKKCNARTVHKEKKRLK